jgi:hypothetical protein
MFVAFIKYAAGAIVLKAESGDCAADPDLGRMVQLLAVAEMRCRLYG